jgi:hypothetical protein
VFPKRVTQAFSYTRYEWVELPTFFNLPYCLTFFPLHREVVTCRALITRRHNTETILFQSHSQRVRLPFFLVVPTTTSSDERKSGRSSVKKACARDQPGAWTCVASSWWSKRVFLSSSVSSFPYSQHFW